MTTRTCLALAGILPAALSSAVQTNGVHVLPSVVVVASPVSREEHVSDDGTESVVLSRDQLSRLNAQDIQTALRQVPGVAISRYGAIGSYGGAQGGSIYIRGLGTARPGGEIRLYADGAPRESGVWGHPLMDALPIDFADAITLQKNPSPAAHAGTFGAVDVTTRRRTKEGAEAELSLAAGRYGTVLASASAGLKEGPVDAYAGLSHKRSDGARSHNASRLDSAFARLGTEFSETDRLSLVYQRTDSQVRDPGRKHGPVPETDRFDLQTDLVTLRFDTDRETLTGFSLCYLENGAIRWHKDHLTDGVPTSPAGQADTFWLNWGTRHRYDWNAWRALTLTGAFDAASEGGSTRNRVRATRKVPFKYSGRFRTAAPYLGARYAFTLSDDWTLTPSAGLRYHLHSVYADRGAPAVSLSLDRKEELRLFVNAARAVHFPGIYTRAVAADFARGILKAETMDTVTAGIELKPADDLAVIASVYRSEVNDKIEKTATSYVNSGSFRATGAEASVHWKPHGSLALFAGGAFARPDRKPVSRLPRWTFTLGGSWKITDHLTWSADGQYVGHMNAYSVRGAADRTDLRPLDDAFVLNTRLALSLKAFTDLDGEIFLALENLANAHYEYYPDYPMGGILWYVGCKLKF